MPHDPDGRRVGNLVLESPEDAGARDIVAVNVTPAHRRTGVATATFRHAERLGLNPTTQSVFFTAAGRALADSLIDRRAAQTCGEMTLFHHTSPVAAAAIMQQRRMTSASLGGRAFAFFSNRRAGNASGPLHYGEACVEVPSAQQAASRR